MLNLDNDRDFPYYSENPRMPKIGWLILLICIPVSYFVYGIIPDEIISSAVFMLMLLIPTLYFSKWDYSLIFQKPTKDELILAVLMFLAYFIYSAIFTTLLAANGIPDVAGSDVNVVSIVSLVFTMMAEELTKFIPLMFLMRVFFKYTSNRRMSIIASSIITLTYFGLIHLTPETSIISVLLIQGMGSAFHLYAYLKTKNLFVSYISHLMTDAIVLTLALMGILSV